MIIPSLAWVFEGDFTYHFAELRGLHFLWRAREGMFAFQRAHTLRIGKTGFELDGGAFS